MKKLGVIGYANNQGIGTMTQDLVEMFNAVHLVTDGQDKPTKLETIKTNNYKLCKSWTPTDEELDWLFSQVDCVTSVETDWNSGFFLKAKAKGVRVAFIPMNEWFDHKLYTGASSYICTTKHCFDQIQYPNRKDNYKVYLPWPLMVEKFPFKVRGKGPNLNFLHNAGFGGMHYRKGTPEVVRAWSLTTNPNIKLTINSQRPIDYFEKDVQDIIKSDKRIIFNNKDFPNMVDIYSEGDIYLYTARFDGQSLVAEEAMLCGFPTFTTDADPMREFTWDPRFNVKVASNNTISMHENKVAVNICDVRDLANKIEWAVNQDLSEVSIKNREYIVKNFSWKNLKSEYEKAFFGDWS